MRDGNGGAPEISALAASRLNGDYAVLAGTGEFAAAAGSALHSVISGDLQHNVGQCIETRESVFWRGGYIGYFRATDGKENLVCLKTSVPFDELARSLVQVFSSSVTVAFDNLQLNQEIVNTQKEVIVTLGGVVETRSKETANHVLRVAEYAYLLAKKSGLDDDQAELLRMAAPMHDVGKIGIPDTILNKPGKLTTEEFDIIKTHTTIGHDILKNSNREIMKTAALIALQHHERWDGSGYPQGLKGEDIHIFGRILGLTDVFDALGRDRVYKKAWNIDKIMALIQEERGKHFDPELAGIFDGAMDEFVRLGQAYSD